MGAEVGVLELQIHDNSSKAASGLGNLASALTRVQKALGSGLRLGNTANQIEKLVTKMQTAIPEESISRIERLAKAVETLNRAGGINLSGIKGLSKEIRENVGEIKSAAEGAVGTKSGAQDDFAEGFNEAKRIVQNIYETSERIDQPLIAIGRTIGVAADNAERLRDAVAEVQSYARLGSGSTPLRLGAGGVPDENALSTWVDYSKQWQTGWTNENNYAPLWTIKEGFELDTAAVYKFAVAMDEAIKKTAQFMSLGSGQAYPLLGAGNAGMELSTWVDRSQQWTPNWTRGQQPRIGSGNPDWIYGSGTVSGANGEFEEVKATTSEIDSNMKSVENSVRETIERARQMSDAMWQAREATKQTAEDANQSRLEKNYPQYRELFMSGEKPWTTQVPQMYGFSPEIIKQCETYAQAVELASGKTVELANDVSQAGEKATEFSAKIGEAKEKTTEFSSRIGDANEKIKETGGKVKYATVEIERLRKSFDSMKSGVANMTSPLTNFIGQLARVAKYRMLRAIVKQISEGFKEGVENYYHYSEAVNNGFSAAMDRAATSLQTFKNSIGAAVAPLIQALIPILQQVVTWVVTAINYVNQFIALLSGKTTWSKAIDTTAKAFENTKKKAGGASKAIKKTDNAVKDLLADFDELNIIQSQTKNNGGSGSGGGGGGVGKTATDFKKMFTEVSKFDNGIKRLVDNLKKNFGSILNLAAEIGAAVLAWNVSSAFSGIIAQAAGLIGSVVVMDIVFKLSKTFTDTFLDTGEEGWLLLSGLTPLVGGFIAKKLLTQVGLRGMASYSIPISLALAATATISAVVNDADVSTMDAKSIEALILAAIEMGGATGLALNSAGVLTAASSAGVGAAAALITFGVAIGLKESAKVLETGKITQESIVTDIGSAAFVGAGLSLSHGVLGLSASSAASAGAAGGLMTFGVLMGLQASLTLAENGEITEAKVWNALGIQAGSSLLIGAGAAILGLGALSSAGLAFASFGLFLALDAIITNNRPKKIMWGDSELTDEQIESWVNDKMFKVNVKATISKIETVVGNNKATRDEIESGMSDVETDLGVIELGLADETTYENLRKSIFGENGEGGVIGRLKQYASEQQVTIKTSMTLLPLLNENGEEDSQRTTEVMKAGLTGWKEVQDYMTSLGGKLSEALKNGSKAGLEGYDDELIQTLTEKLTNVQRAVTGAQLSSTATGDLLTNLTGLSAGDAQGILDTYERYKEQLSDGYNKILQEELSSYQGLAAFYRARGEEGDNELAKYYEGLASELVKQWPERVARGVEEAGGEGKKIIAEKLSELFMLSPSDLTGRVYNDALQRSMAGALEISIRNSNMQNSSDVKDAMKGWLDSILKASLTEGDYNIVSGALSSGILKYTDLFSQETIDQLTSQWQGDNNPYKNVIREAWQEMLADALGKKPKKIVAEEAEVEQPVVAEAEVVEATVDDEGGFDWSNFNLGAGNFDFELTDFHGAGTMAEWEDLWDAMFSNGTGTEAAANALRGRLDEIVEMAFLGTGQGSKILEALKNGDLNYGDVIQQSVLQSIEEALGLEYDSPEIQEKWNAILEEIFGGEYAPELEVDPEVTGKTSGAQWATRAAQTAIRASSGYTGDNSIWVNGALVREEQDRTAEKENVQAGVSAGTFTMQQTLQTGMANRQGDIQSGVQAGTGSLLTALNSILSVAQAINNKQFTVNIVPSTTLGVVTRRSGQGLSKVTGNMEAPT